MGKTLSFTAISMKDTALLHQLDAIDWKIMKILQEDGRLSNAELAERVSLSARLEAAKAPGIVRRDPRLPGRAGPTRAGHGRGGLRQHLAGKPHRETCQAFEASVAMPEVMACHNTTGQHDYLLHIMARDFDAYSEFVRNRLRTLPGVKELLSTLSMHEVKSSTRLHL